MSKLSEIVYMILDELKGFNRDFSYTEDHIIFLINNYRALLLKKEYETNKYKKISPSNYKTICLELEPVETICGEQEGFYMRSKEEIPNTMGIGYTKISPCSFFTGDIDMVEMERFRYVGEGRFSANSIYGTVGPDKHVYLKSNNPQFRYLEKIQVTAVFEENPSDVGCNPLEEEYPIEKAYIPIIIESIIRELSAVVYKPEDVNNDNRDQLSNVGMMMAKNQNDKVRTQ